MNALFASDKDLLREYEDTKALLKLSDHLLSKAHLTNHQYLTAAPFRIVSVLGKVLNRRLISVFSPKTATE